MNRKQQRSNRKKNTLLRKHGMKTQKNKQNEPLPSAKPCTKVPSIVCVFDVTDPVPSNSPKHHSPHHLVPLRCTKEPSPSVRRDEIQQSELVDSEQIGESTTCPPTWSSRRQKPRLDPSKVIQNYLRNNPLPTSNHPSYTSPFP